MRHGLMLWREDELSQADVMARQHRLQAEMRRAGLDAMVIYTNHVRSAAVTYLTGFTPYWSDALLMVPAEGQIMFATALSKRVGNWIRSTNPTAELAHSPKPGGLVGERLHAMQAARIGVVELDRLPGGLVREICDGRSFDLVDGTACFAAARARPDAAELGLVALADRIAADAFASLPEHPACVGDVSEAAELAVRQAGAEECYVAIAPDLAQDTRLARRKGDIALGNRFALRLSVAYNGVWVRRTGSIARDAGDSDCSSASAFVDHIARVLNSSLPIARQLEDFSVPDGLEIVDWAVEAPVATRPLQVVESMARGREVAAYPYGILTLTFEAAGGPLVFARAFGHGANAALRTEVA